MHSPEFLMKKTQGIFLVISNSTNFWPAAFPVLKRLLAAGHTVHIAVAKSSPLRQLIADKGFPIIELKDTQLWNGPKTLEEMSDLLLQYKPDCVLVGVADTPAGSEKTALNIARMANIPIVVLIESWPHGWLGVYGEGDFPIYQVVNTTCVMDNLSKFLLISHGWPSELVIVTGNPLKDVLTSSLNHGDAARKPVPDATCKVVQVLETHLL